MSHHTTQYITYIKRYELKPLTAPVGNTTCLECIYYIMYIMYCSSEQYTICNVAMQYFDAVQCNEMTVCCE